MNQGRKISGGKYHPLRKKKKFERLRQDRVVILRETKRKILRVKGGNTKAVLLSSDEANVYNPKTKKTTKIKIKNVIETPQNVFLARQNRLMKSSVIETSLGKARITNRPSQEGHVNATLIDEK